MATPGPIRWKVAAAAAVAGGGMRIWHEIGGGIAF